MARGRGRPRERPIQKRLSLSSASSLSKSPAVPNPSGSQSSSYLRSTLMVDTTPVVPDSEPISPRSTSADQSAALYASWVSVLRGVIPTYSTNTIPHQVTVPLASPTLVVSSIVSNPAAAQVVTSEDALHTAFVSHPSMVPSSVLTLISSHEMRPKAGQNIGTLSSSVKITFNDIAHEFTFWQSFVVCFFHGANPPLHVIDARRIWKNLGIDMVVKGVFLVRFQSMEDMKSACSMNGIIFDKKPFIVKPWTKNMSGLGSFS